MGSMGMRGSAGYFRVLQTPFFAGRDFNDRDTPFSPKVAVVNETFARQAFGDPTRLGGRFTDGADEFEVVGIVGNSKLHSVREDFRPIVYTAASQVAEPGLTVRFVLRSRIDMRATVDSVRRAVTEFDPTAGIRFATLDSLAADSLQRERLMASLSGFFGITAIALAAVGVYGVVSFSAASRRREIGIRLALGARGAHVIRAVVGRLALVVGVGLIVGLVLALPANAATRSLLYGVDPREPWVMALIAAVIAGAGVVAAVVPAHRALSTDPVTVLRSE